MSHLEPSYLRYIYDGLEKGDLHHDNAAALPEGLIGLYDEAFDESKPARERQKLLNTFGLWSLLKKEVSAQFVAEILDLSTQEIIDFIATYSNWFTSPESSKYQLYHERLKVYLLQKMSEGEVAKLNGLIIDFLEQNVNEKDKNETVRYCYENLSFHLYINEYFFENSNLLSKYCLDELFKKRQFEISGNYDWEEKLMVFGVQYYSLKKNTICHQIVFEKTKVQFKKKDVDFIISLVRSDKFELVFSLFKSLNEKELEERIATAYLYSLTFFEIFELPNKNFIQKKEIAYQLLEVFDEYFQWDKGGYLAQFIDINICFKLNCYFVQFGLDFKKIAVLSSEHKAEYFGLDIRYQKLKFLDTSNKEEAIYILKQHKIFDYGYSLADNQIKDFVDELIQNSIKNSAQKNNHSLCGKLTSELLKLGKNELLKGEGLLEIVENEIYTFNELILTIKFILGRDELAYNVKKVVCLHFQNSLLNDSNGQLEFIGSWYQGDLKIQKKNTLHVNEDSFEVFKNLNLPNFDKLESIKKYNILKSIIINDVVDKNELNKTFLYLSEHYSSLKNKDIFDLFSSIIVEYTIELDFEKIDLLQSELLNFIVHSEHYTEEFEDKIFEELIIFLRISQLRIHLRKFLKKIKEQILEIYFDFNFYNYSFKQGVELINLFNEFKIDFPEDEIVDRILEDLNYLIEDNDYNQMWQIENSSINNIFQKTYFWLYYTAVKRIQIEQVRNSLSKHIFKDILQSKGLNQSTLNFFLNNKIYFPEMYLWTKKSLSIKISETDLERSYQPIIDRNDLILERLLLNIVSNRNNFKVALNIEILKYYGLDWLLELDKEYEILSAKN